MGGKSNPINTLSLVFFLYGKFRIIFQVSFIFSTVISISIITIIGVVVFADKYM